MFAGKACMLVRGVLTIREKMKMSGKERRAFILETLKKSEKPITGQEFADLTGVSRQVIVTDIALLKTGSEPIIATNRGYLLMDAKKDEKLFRRVIVCQHEPDRTQEELEAIVDCGVTVVNVIVEHPIYGDLTGSLMIRSRYEVEQFMKEFLSHEATLLSVLTNGLHLHTIEADSVDKLDAACHALRKAGILYTE